LNPVNGQDFLLCQIVNVALLDTLPTAMLGKGLELLNTNCRSGILLAPPHCGVVYKKTERGQRPEDVSVTTDSCVCVLCVSNHVIHNLFQHLVHFKNNVEKILEHFTVM